MGLNHDITSRDIKLEIMTSRVMIFITPPFARPTVHVCHLRYDYSVIDETQTRNVRQLLH